MPRKRAHTRRAPKGNPAGILDVRLGGYGFVRTAEGEYYIPQSKMGTAFHGDLVEIAPLPRQGGKSSRSVDESHPSDRPHARVVRVVDRSFDTVIGRYEIAEPFGVVIPEDPRLHHDIFTLLSDYPDIPAGALVRVRVTTFPERNTAATGVIEEVLGLGDDGSVDTELIMARHGLTADFSSGSLAEAREAELDVPGALLQGYRDLRERFVFTVDPADARDFDDAVSLEPVEDKPGVKWRLGVHIADVSHYVPWDSSLDLDARKKACSVYLADRVLPMLPEELSADLCSLKPGEERRTLTVDLYLNDDFVVTESEIYPAIIRSDVRLDYGQAQMLLEKGLDAAMPIEPDVKSLVVERLEGLSDMAQARLAARLARGGMDFDSPEVKAVIDESGKAVGYTVRTRTLATSLIEESMIMANECVARRLARSGHPGMFRVHEQPDPVDLMALIPVLREFSWFSEVDEGRFATGDPLTLSEVLTRSAGTPESLLVSSLLLRSMKRAVYRPECLGHYGLASQAYTHFTSPIRRYPDLVVHRMIKDVIGLPRGIKRVSQDQNQALPWLSQHSSDMERVAEKAARESQESKLLQLMEGCVGEAFPGVVSGVMAYGLYVRLENSLEGLVGLGSLGSEYYAHDSVRHTLTGEDSGRVFRLGQKISVVVKAVDVRSSSLALGLDREQREETLR